MGRYRKVFVLAAVGAAGLLGAPAVASADTLECTVDGVTGSLNPPARAVLNGTPGVTTNGTYSFNGGVTCVHNHVPVVQGGSIVASGTYSYAYCGTGTWTGTATVSIPSVTATLSYRADLTSMHGAIDVYEVNGRRELRPVSIPATTLATPDYDGPFTTRPATGNCINSDVTSFGVATDFSIVW